MGLYDTKYYPDKFYIKFDVDKVENILHLDENNEFSIELAIFIHEFYHYLTNISTFQGLRAFNVSFQDKIRIITIVQKRCAGLDGFPLFKNNRKDCKSLIDYWKHINEIILGDSALRQIASEISNSPNKKVSIKNIRIEPLKMEVPLDNEKILGIREMVFLEADGIPTSSFMLPIAAIDEFLSSSIDEYLFQTNTTDNLELLKQRPFYPYLIFDEILRFFGIYRLDAKHKILIAYKALHGQNPVVNMIQIIDCISKDFDNFIANPIDFLENRFHWNEQELLVPQLEYLFGFIQECNIQKRYNLANVSSIIYERGRVANLKLQEDPYFFIRPFIEYDFSTTEGRAGYIDFIKNLLINFDGFLQLKGRELININTDPEKNHLALMLAMYEILNGVENNKIIERKERRYDFDGKPESDKLENLPDTLPLTLIWHNALNDLSFYALYLKYRNS